MTYRFRLPLFALFFATSCALRAPAPTLPPPELAEWAAALAEAVEEGNVDRVDRLLLERVAAGPGVLSEGDVYARMISSPSIPDPGPLAERIARVFLERVPGHPSLWRAHDVLFLRAAGTGALNEMSSAWDGLRGARVEHRAARARTAGEILWRGGLSAAAIRWSETSEELAPTTGDTWSLLASRAWTCCGPDQLAGSRLSGLVALRDALRLGDADAVRAAAAELRRAAPHLGGPWQELVRWANALPDRRGGVRGDRVVTAMLPITGRSAGLGRRTLETLAACLLPGESLDIRDTYGSAILGAAAMPLDETHRPTFGPLRTESLPLASLRLLRYGRVAVTPNPNPLRDLPVTSTVWSIALTPEVQARELAKWLAEQDWRAVAFLGPSNEAGERFLNAFWPAVTGGGGWFTGIGRFDADTTDFGAAIRRIVGLDRYDADELEALKADGLEPEPVIDFDVMVIVGPPRQIGLIPAQLAYWDVVGVRLAGDAAWGTQEAYRLAEGHARGLLFVDLAAGENDPQGALLANCVERASSLDQAVFEGLRLLQAWRMVPDPGKDFPPVPGLGGELRPGPDRVVGRTLGRWILTDKGRAPWDGSDPLAGESSP